MNQDIPYLPVDAFRRNISDWIEMMAAAYLKATDIPPEQCMLVVQDLPSQHKMIYRFERRAEQETKSADLFRKMIFQAHAQLLEEAADCPWCSGVITLSGEWHDDTCPYPAFLEMYGSEKTP